MTRPDRALIVRPLRAAARRAAGAARRRHTARLRLPEAGGASVELVLAVPALMLLLLGIVQFAVLENAQHVAQAAASAGLAAERVQGGSAAAGRAQAAGILAASAGGILHVSAISATRGAASASITITGHAQAVIPFVNLAISVSAAGPVEAP